MITTIFGVLLALPVNRRYVDGLWRRLSGQESSLLRVRSGYETFTIEAPIPGMKLAEKNWAVVVNEDGTWAASADEEQFHGENRVEGPEEPRAD